MTYRERCTQSLISYTTLRDRDRMYMDNVFSFFSLLGTRLHALPSGAGWFMRHMPVFSWLVWLHSQLSGTVVAKTIKIHTCTELLGSQIKHRQSLRKQVIWGILLSLIRHIVQLSVGVGEWLMLYMITTGGHIFQRWCSKHYPCSYCKPFILIKCLPSIFLANNNKYV